MAIQQQPHKGMTLLEVLVAVVLLSVAMLGIASMLMLSGKTNNSSYSKHEATLCADNIIERMRANSQVVAGGSYDISNINSNGGPGTVAAPAADCALLAVMLLSLHHMIHGIGSPWWSCNCPVAVVQSLQPPEQATPVWLPLQCNGMIPSPKTRLVPAVRQAAKQILCPI